METDCSPRSRRPASTVNEADKQAFIDASEPIYDEFGEEVEGGSELVRRVRDADPGAATN